MLLLVGTSYGSADINIEYKNFSILSDITGGGGRGRGGFNISKSGIPKMFYSSISQAQCFDLYFKQQFSQISFITQ